MRWAGTSAAGDQRERVPSARNQRGVGGVRITGRRSARRQRGRTAISSPWSRTPGALRRSEWVTSRQACSARARISASGWNHAGATACANASVRGPSKKPISRLPPGRRCAASAATAPGSSAGGRWMSEYHARTPPRPSTSSSSAEPSRNGTSGNRARASATNSGTGSTPIAAAPRRWRNSVQCPGPQPRRRLCPPARQPTTRSARDRPRAPRRPIRAAPRTPPPARRTRPAPRPSGERRPSRKSAQRARGGAWHVPRCRWHSSAARSTGAF